RPNSVAIEQRSVPAFLVSLAAHAAMAALVVIVTRSTRPSPQDTPRPSDAANIRMVWLTKPGFFFCKQKTAYEMKEPPRRVELPGHDALTVPAKPSLQAQVSTLSASL